VRVAACAEALATLLLRENSTMPAASDRSLQESNFAEFVDLLERLLEIFLSRLEAQSGAPSHARAREDELLIGA
jgi:hypothetical protein